jgi:hypothetical protein
MKHHRHHATRPAVAAVATLAAAVSLVGAAPAQGAVVTGSSITVKASDSDVRSGEQFRLRGIYRVWLETDRPERVGADLLPDATVRVRTYRKGDWVRLRGAVVTTDDEGRYRIRVVLRMKGERALRVVATPEDPTFPKARADIVVNVR